MQTLNFSTQAKEFFVEMVLAAEGMAFETDLFSFLSVYMDESVKFMLPEDGVIFDSGDFDPKFFDLMRLPFPQCALEFEATDALFSEGTGLQRSRRRISLCFDPYKLPLVQQQRLSRLIGQDLLSRMPENVICMMAVYDVHEMGVSAWGSAGGVLVLDLSEENRPRASSTPEENALTESVRRRLGPDKKRTKHGLSMDFLPFMSPAIMRRFTKAQCIENLYLDSIDEVRAAYDFLAAINCSNVQAETIAAPKMLNAKRAKKGKPLFYDYKVLNFSSGAGASESGAGGSHASPRTHLRRGHLRHLNERQGGKTIFIQATMVNQSERPGPVVDRYLMRRPKP